MYRISSGSLKVAKTALLSAVVLLSACRVEQNGALPDAVGFQAQVLAVHDGDTIRVQDSHGQQHRIRLAYIDAPELQQTGGKESRDCLREAVLAKKVSLEIFDQDQYRRKVARVMFNGVDINLQQIRQGQAWHYRSIARKKQNLLDYQTYERAESQAKSARVGLWRNHRAQEPWLFRHQNRTKNSEN